MNFLSGWIVRDFLGIRTLIWSQTIKLFGVVSKRKKLRMRNDTLNCIPCWTVINLNQFLEPIKIHHSARRQLCLSLRSFLYFFNSVFFHAFYVHLYVEDSLETTGNEISFRIPQAGTETSRPQQLSDINFLSWFLQLGKSGTISLPVNSQKLYDFYIIIIISRLRFHFLKQAFLWRICYSYILFR